MGNADLLVAGGGLAGCAAALQGVREGLKVLLVERGSYLGGNATRGMVAPWQSFHASTSSAAVSSGVEAQEPRGPSPADKEPAYGLSLEVASSDPTNSSPPRRAALPEQVISGIAQELVDDLVARGASLGHIVDPIGFAGSLTPVDAEALKLYLPEKLLAASVRIELNRTVEFEELQAARFVIDATGQATAARMLGAEVRLAEEPQPMSWLFTMTDVDTAAVRDYQLACSEQFVLHPRLRELRADFIAVSGFFDLVRGARASGELSIPRDRLLFFSTPRPGEVLVNTTRIPADHPQPRLEGLRQVAELAAWLPRRVPGFARAKLGRIADDIGERESTRLAGEYTLSVDDLTSGKRFPDAIARGCYPIDVHSASSDELETRTLGGPGWYDIPARCLKSPQVQKLLVAGRCISADAAGFASARTLPTAMATGQAAAMLAAMKILGKNDEFPACLSAVSLV